MSGWELCAGRGKLGLMPRYRVIARVDEHPEVAGAVVAVTLEHFVGWGYEMSDLSHTGGVVEISCSHALTPEQQEHLGLEAVV